VQLNQVPHNYDRAAKQYDWWADIVFGRILGYEKLREHTIDLLGDLEGQTVLDVGCGTGRNLSLLVERVGEHGQVIGIDYSEGMLNQARRRVQANGWHNVQLIRGDAATLEGVPEEVDAVISVWCYGIVYDLEAALKRALETLKPGGPMAIMDFAQARPDYGMRRWLYPVYSKVLQWIGIDTAEDLDDAKLREKWRHGKRVLNALLDDLREQTYAQGAGIILSGTAPNSQRPSPRGLGLATGKQRHRPL